MKRGTTVTNEYDRCDKPCVVIRKKRGKLSVDEIEEILRYEDFQQWNGYYAMILNRTESTVGGNGCLELMEDDPGDTITLYEITDSGECPVCSAFLPPFQYCPSCGSSWTHEERNIETLLADMRREAERCIKNPNSAQAARLAWYWSHIGSIDLARQLGLITEERRTELYEEMKAMKPDSAACPVIEAEKDAQQ